MARRKRSRWSLPLMAAVLLAIAVGRLLGQLEEPDEAGRTQQVPSADEPKPERAPPARKPKREQRKPSRAQSVFASDSPWASPEACEAALVQARKLAAPKSPRIGTWNLGWFPDGSAKGDDPERVRDVPWLACVIAMLDVQVLAVQEVVQHPRGRAALLDLRAQLDARTGGKWQAVLDDCKDDRRQHVGFLYDESRVTLLGTQMQPELNPGRSACDLSLRPGFVAKLRWKNGGPDLGALTLHLDSGSTPRDYGHRKTSIARMRGVVHALRAEAKGDDDVIALGDYNTMGCDECEPKVSAEEELLAFDTSADAFSPSLMNVPPTHACTEYYRGRGVRLDHVLATRGMRELAQGARVETHGLCAQLACERFPSAPKVPAVLRLSDHCPLVLQLQARDRDARHDPPRTSREP